MSVIVYASGTQTAVIGTEHFLSSPNVAGQFRLFLDLSVLLANDVLEVRAYKMVLAGGTSRQVWVGVFYGVQPAYSLVYLTDWLSNVLTDANAARFSITQTFGTGRAIPWSVQQETDQADVTKWNGTAVAAVDTAGYPKVTLKTGAGAGEIAITGGVVNANSIQISGDSTAADRLENLFDGLYSGTAQGGASTTITLDTGASVTNDLYNGLSILITGGVGAGQARSVSDYVGSSRLLTVDSAWAVNPDNTSTYQLFLAGSGSGGGGGTDPLLNDVPGSYASGTAGYVLGHLDDMITVIRPLYDPTNQKVTVPYGSDLTATSALGRLKIPSTVTTLNLLTAGGTIYFAVRQTGEKAGSGWAFTPVTCTAQDAETALVSLSNPTETRKIQPGNACIWSLWHETAGGLSTPLNSGIYVVQDTVPAVN